MSESRGKRQLELAQAILPEVETLRLRSQVRVVIPAEIKLYVRLRARKGGVGPWRGVVIDLSSQGMAMDLIEGGRFDPPQEGEEVSADLELEGQQTTVEGWIARSSSHSVGCRFRHSAAHDDELDVGLLGLLAQIAARNLVRIERRPAAAAVPANPAPPHEHFCGAGHLDVRVNLHQPPVWWQLVFLEYVVSWSEEEGLATATTDSSFAIDADAFFAPPRVVRHERPWRSLCKLALQVAVHCAAAQPRHGEAFALIQKTVRTAMT